MRRPLVEEEPDAEPAAADECSQGRFGKREAIDASVSDVDAEVCAVIAE